MRKSVYNWQYRDRLRYGEGQIIYVPPKWGRKTERFQARITRKGYIVFSKNYDTELQAFNALRHRSGKSNDEIKKLSFTFEEIYNRWLDAPSGAGRLASNSKNVLISSYNQYCRILKDREFASLTADDLQVAIDDCKAGASRKNQLKALFNHLYTIALNMEIVGRDKSATLYISPEKTERQKSTIERTNFEDSEVNALIANAGEISDLLTFMFYTGCRISEAVNLRSESIDFENKMLKPYFNPETGESILFGVKSESGKTRKVPVHSKLVPILERNAVKKYVFGQKSGEKPYAVRTIQAMFKEALENAGLDTRRVPHETRHTVATKLITAGMDKSLVKKILGHANSSVTDIYTHYSDEDLREIVERIEYNS